MYIVVDMDIRVTFRLEANRLYNIFKFLSGEPILVAQTLSAVSPSAETKIADALYFVYSSQSLSSIFLQYHLPFKAILALNLHKLYLSDRCPLNFCILWLSSEFDIVRKESEIGIY